MYKRIISAFILILGIFLAVGTVSAATTTVLITVVDEYDSRPVSGASVFVDGSYVGVTDVNGQFEHTHSFVTNYRIGVKKNGYEYWNNQITPGKTTVDVELVREKGSLTVNVLQADSLEPLENAIVEVVGIDLDARKSTDFNGKAEFAVSFYTSYSVTVKMTNYETIVKTVEMADTSKSVDYLMQRNDLVIFQILDGESSTKVPLAGAELYLDGKLSGETGADGKVNLNIEHEKSYLIAVKKTNYEPFEESHYFSSDEILYTATLYKSLNPVTVSVYDAQKRPLGEAEIYIDSVLTGLTDSYGRSGVKQLSSGNHVILVRKAGYNDYQTNIDVNPTTDNVIVELTYSSAKIAILVLDKDNNFVGDATVSANGRVLGVTDATGKLSTELITNADYTFTVTAKDYKDYSDMRQVPLGCTEMNITFIIEKDSTLITIVGIILLIAVIGIAAYVIINRGGFGRGGGGSQRRPSRRRDDGGL